MVVTQSEDSRRVAAIEVVYHILGVQVTANVCLFILVAGCAYQPRKCRDISTTSEVRSTWQGDSYLGDAIL